MPRRTWLTGIFFNMVWVGSPCRELLTTMATLSALRQPCLSTINHEKSRCRQRLSSASNGLQRNLDCGTVCSSPGSVARYLEMAFSSASLNCLTWPAMMALLRPTLGLPSVW
jgi:hypothetical protein